ncbi:hypothetical protein [Pedobacter foliorum]|uniref:hypothetical protein n=1 Tax=Pedobacter foliorum TaxID=2739058 RepID=UPI0015656B16|nr:hypothetical protein [Pedobacter foliorum]NRF38239.1 hypothetical protein [Pedobacter foliorum]
MKNSTKFFATAVAAVALFFTTSANAQKLGVGINLGVPTTDGYSFAVGADARLQFDVSKQVSIPVTAGYTHFLGKTVGGFDVPDFGYIPLKGGVKVFFDETGSGLYGLGEIGAGFGVTKGSGTSFLYSPAVGYAFSSGLDLGVKYEGLSKGGGNLGQVALRIAYGFKL